jgi:hypothetical protein
LGSSEGLKIRLYRFPFWKLLLVGIEETKANFLCSSGTMETGFIGTLLSYLKCLGRRRS